MPRRAIGRTWRRSGPTTRRSAASRATRRRLRTCSAAAGSGARTAATAASTGSPRVDHDRVVATTRGSPRRPVAEAVAWIRRLRREGAAWDVLPVPTRPRAVPARSETARTSRGIAPSRRRERARGADAAARYEPRAPTRRPRGGAAALGRPRGHGTAARRHLGTATPPSATRCSRRTGARGPEVVLPARIRPRRRRLADAGAARALRRLRDRQQPGGRLPRLPEAGGQPLIFQIGCGRYEGDEWRFWQRTATRLDEPSEARVIDEWVAHVEDALARRAAWAGPTCGSSTGRTRSPHGSTPPTTRRGRATPSEPGRTIPGSTR